MIFTRFKHTEQAYTDNHNNAENNQLYIFGFSYIIAAYYNMCYKTQTPIAPIKSTKIQIL